MCVFLSLSLSLSLSPFFFPHFLYIYFFFLFFLPLRVPGRRTTNDRAWHEACFSVAPLVCPDYYHHEWLVFFLLEYTYDLFCLCLPLTHTILTFIPRYEVLGVERDATERQIKDASNDLLRRAHSDKVHHSKLHMSYDEQQWVMNCIKMARDNLLDYKTRKEHDEFLAALEGEGWGPWFKRRMCELKDKFYAMHGHDGTNDHRWAYAVPSLCLPSHQQSYRTASHSIDSMFCAFRHLLSSSLRTCW